MTMSTLLLLLLIIITSVRAQVQFDSSTCGIGKGCLFSPPGCDPNNNCAKAFSWKVVGDFLKMELAGISSGGTTNYIAVGFSSDNLMGNEPVTDCTFGSSGAATHLSYNPGTYNQRITNYAGISSDLQLTNSSTNNGRLYCAFQQRIFPSQSNSQVLSLNRTVYIFLVVGQAIDQALNAHSMTQGSPSYPFVSSTTINLMDPMMMMEQVQFDYSTCGTGKGCIFSPLGCDPANNCAKTFTWKVVGDYLNMELIGVSSGGSTNYIAVGFSSDNLMGNEPVTDCTFGQQGVTTHLSYNPGTYNQRVTNYPAQSTDLQLMNSSAINGHLYCAFRQRIQPSQSNSQVLPLNRTVYILLVVGTATDQALNAHTLTLGIPNSPFVSPGTVNLPNAMTMAPQVQFDNSTCGTVKGCIFSPPGCNPAINCAKGFSWRVVGDYLSMELMGVSSGGSTNYIAVGFSSDNLMGNEPVTDCTIGPQGAAAHLSYNNPGTYNQRITNYAAISSDLQLMNSSTINGNLYCAIQQRIFPSQSNSQVFSLNRTVYILLAVGTAADQALNAHTLTLGMPNSPFVSSGTVNLPNAMTMMAPQAQFDSSTCGTVKGCIFSPPGCNPAINCAKAFSWKVAGDYLNMELMGVSSGGSINYIAVGFSSDNLMGNEPVTDCTFGLQGAAAHLSYNPGTYNQRITNYAAISSDLQLLNSSTINGNLYCAIQQRIFPSQSNSQVLSLNRTVYILLAVGTATDQALNAHTLTLGIPSSPFVSSGTVSLPNAMTMVTQAQFDSSTCSTGKSCMFSPPGCDPNNNCTKAFSWKVVGDFLNMELAGISSGGTTNYIAVGFSSDNLMGDEPVTDCTFGPNGAATHLSYNPATYNQRITNYTAMNNDLQLMNSSTNNGRLYCAIQQRIFPSQSNSQVLPLNRTVYILLAVGTVTDQVFNQHSLTPGSPSYPFVSSSSVNLTNATTMPSQSQSQFDSSTCGTGKGCLFSPPGCDPNNNCAKAFSWKLAGDFLDMELAGVSSGGSSNYIAVGFSTDSKMGNEPVTDCTFGPQGAATHLSYNPGAYNQRITNYVAMSNDLQLMSSNTNNGRLYCAFRQRIIPSQSNSQVLPLNGNVSILLATGMASDQGLNAHSLSQGSPAYPFVDSTSRNLSDPKSSGVGQSSSGISDIVRGKLIKAHGIMMILAWFIFVATAIMFARYFRGHWPDTKPMGVLLWFHFHRTLNALALLLIIAAFVSIFVATGQWTGPTPGQDSDWGSVHSMTGILAVCLAVVQPVGAIFRCSPGKPLRPIFNWLHRFAGISAWLLAAASIAIMVKQFPDFWSNTNLALILLIAYLVFVGVIIILQELLTICGTINGRSASSIDVMEEHAEGKAPISPTMPTTPTVTTNSKTKSIRLLLMGLFVVFGSGMAIALVVLIIMN